MREDIERLRDIQEAIVRIEKHTAAGRDAFDRDELIQTWVLHHLRIIGEAVRAITPEFREKHPELPWSQIVGMRHILVHHYFAIDLDVVWSVVERDLPELCHAVETILSAVGDSEAETS